MSLAVAKTKTLLVCSCIQVSRRPNILLNVPLSFEDEFAPLKPLSSSSIHKIHGDIASAISRASRKLRSESPTYPPIKRSISMRSMGSPHSLWSIFAARLFPQPGTPQRRIPLKGDAPLFPGMSLRSSIKLWFFLTQFENAAIPPSFLKFPSSSEVFFSEDFLFLSESSIIVRSPPDLLIA